MVQNIDSGRVDFLERLKEVTETAVKDLILPTRIQKEGEEPGFRAPYVYLMRLPDSKSATKKAPYIIHTLLTGMDQQAEGNPVESTVKVRTIFCVYNNDEQEGGLALLGVMERLRIHLLRHTVIGERYRLDLTTGMEALFYPDDTAPYFAGEMMSTWRIPSIEREVRQWLQ